MYATALKTYLDTKLYGPSQIKVNIIIFTIISVIDMFTKENNVLSEQNTIAFIVVYTSLSTVAGIFKSINN